MAGAGLDLAERMQLGRPRRPEQAVPRLGADAHHTGEPSLEIAEFDRADERGKIRAERALLQIVVQSRQSFPNPITEELAVIRNSMWQKCLCHPSVIGTFRERSEAHRNCSSNESM